MKENRVLEEQLQVVCHKPIQPEQIRLSNFADVMDAKLQIVKTISLIMWVLLGVNLLGLITALFLRDSNLTLGFTVSLFPITIIFAVCLICMRDKQVLRKIKDGDCEVVVIPCVGVHESGPHHVIFYFQGKKYKVGFQGTVATYQAWQRTKKPLLVVRCGSWIRVVDVAE